MEGVEAVANINSELNNALRIEGIVSDDLLSYQPENQNFKIPFGRAQQVLENLTEAAEAINQLASAAIEITESTTELDKAWDEFQTQITSAKEEKTTKETEKDAQNVPPNSEKVDFARYEPEPTTPPP